VKKIILSGLIISLASGISACSQQRVIPEAGRITSTKVIPSASQVRKNKHNAYRQQKKQYRKHYVANLPRPVSKPYNISSATPVSQDSRSIGDKIFQNECGGRMSNLVHWNRGENFASMGIGHFTWYPAGPRKTFGNTFPGLLAYMESRGVQLPGWLQIARHQGAPWRSRSQLMRAKNSPQVRQLQQLLYDTRGIQADYIIQRAQRAMPRLVRKSPRHLRPHVASNLNAVANTRGGWYALVDYVNFKGEGLNRHGGYRGQNWGLLQVLEEMNPSAPGQQALNNFSTAAMRVLQRRVRNSPSGRNEARWLAGWSKRVNTYRNL
jgi:hypothetical protein